MPTPPDNQADHQTRESQSGDIDDDLRVPPLHYVSTVVVPLKQDLLAPIDPPKNQAEKMERKRTSLDANEKAVRDNMAWAVEREARRLLATAKRTRPLNDPAFTRPITWAEGEKLLHHVAAAARPQQNQHVSPDTLTYWRQNAASLDDASLTPHERTTREVLRVAGEAAKQMEIYSTQHVKPIRDRLSVSSVRER